MLNVKEWITIIMLISLAFVAAGCSKDIPSQVSDRIEEIYNVKIGFVALIDSDSGQTKYLKHEKADADPFFSFNKSQPASDIRRVTSVSVVGVSGIKIAEVHYQSCNYITFGDYMKNNQTELICRNLENQGLEERPYLKKASEIPIISEDLGVELGKAGGIENIGFLVLTDINTGKTKLLRHENYVSLPVSFPQSISEIKSSSAWNVITYRKNPCCQLVQNSDGTMENICKKKC